MNTIGVQGQILNISFIACIYYVNVNIVASFENMSSYLGKSTLQGTAVRDYLYLG